MYNITFKLVSSIYEKNSKIQFMISVKLCNKWKPSMKLTSVFFLGTNKYDSLGQETIGCCASGCHSVATSKQITSSLTRKSFRDPLWILSRTFFSPIRSQKYKKKLQICWHLLINMTMVRGCMLHMTANMHSCLTTVFVISGSGSSLVYLWDF